jgi:hypothetical protein
MMEWVGKNVEVIVAYYNALYIRNDWRNCKNSRSSQSETGLPEYKAPTCLQLMSVTFVYLDLEWPFSFPPPLFFFERRRFGRSSHQVGLPTILSTKFTLRMRTTLASEQCVVLVLPTKSKGTHSLMRVTDPGCLFDTNSVDKRRSLGRYNSLADCGHGV